MIRFFLLLIALPFTQPAAGQVPTPEIHHVRWPLLDIIMVPDSASIWIVAGPNTGTRQWGKGSNLVHFSVDPVPTLQWVTIARRLEAPPPGRSLPDSATQAAPPLRARQGRAFIFLGTNTEKPSTERSFILLVSDSASGTHWKAFASAAQVDSLLTAMEVAVSTSQLGDGTGWKGLGCQKVDRPVRIVSQRTPEYPSQLANRAREGRVWMTYVVSPDGRPDQHSFLPVLSDDPLFTQAATDALRHSRFKPANTAGKPVPQRVFQAVVFRQR